MENVKSTAQSLGLPLSILALMGLDMFFWIGGGSQIIWALADLSDNVLFTFLDQQFHHPKWDGCPIYDLIHVFFLFLIGVQLPYSLEEAFQRRGNKSAVYRHVVKRFILLFFLGLLFNNLLSFNFSTMRWAGVLQRFAFCYLFAALIMLNTSIRMQAIVAGALLLLHWLMLTLIPVPGYGAGILTLEGNLAAYLDRLFLPGRLCCYGAGDNEGVLSIISATSTALLGILAGHWLRHSVSAGKKLKGFLLAGIAGVIAAYFIDIWYPINKYLWTASFVLLTAGWSTLFVGVFHWIIDVKDYMKWAVFYIIIGMNPITLYITQQLFDFGTIPRIFVRGFIDYLGPVEPLFWVLCLVGTKWLFTYVLYRQKVFFKL